MIRCALVAGAVVLATATPSQGERARTFAGSLQLDYLAVPTERQARLLTFDGATVELSLRLTVDVSDNISAHVKACFACHGFEAGMAYVDFRIADAFHVRVGRMSPAFGAFANRHDPANHLTSDKPLPYDMGRMLRRDEWNEGVLPVPWVDNGVEVGGTRFFEGGQFEWAAYAMAGPKGNADAADFDFIASRSGDRYYIDNNSQPAIGGRLGGAIELRGHGTLSFGGSAMVGTYDPQSKLSFVIAGIDAAVDLHALIIRGEYLVRRTEMDLGADPASRFKFGPNSNGVYDNYFVKDGFYLEAELPIDRVSVIGRVDGLRRIGNVLVNNPLDSHDHIVRFTGGIAVRAASAVRIKASAEYYQLGSLGNELGLHLGVATPF